ncbi:MAG: malate dehydrogenase [Acidobacteria bacterium]|nr:MAG: malate dehydrogenase [Acidobacteriota bacterium]
MPNPDVLIPAVDLAAFAASLLDAVGVSPAKSKLVAESLAAANLRGVDSHGVQLLPYYIEQLEWGDMDARADGCVVSENGACLLYDGQNGIGQAVAEICCRHAVRIARNHGLSMVVARDSNHFGATAFWAQKISAAGHIGIVMCNASPIVPPWQGREPRVGTNPICMSVPGGEKAWLLDMATTTVAAGRIFKALINGQPSIPSGWAMDSEGLPTTDTQTALKGLLMPLGGYKGSGLALMVEILCAVLSGGAMSTELGGIRIRGKQVRVSQTFISIDIARFLPLDEFHARMGQLIGSIKSTAPAKGYDEVLVAGEPEWRMEQERREAGVPVGPGTWKALCEAADRLSVIVPSVA